MYLNPFVFLFFKEGEVLLWDYKHHQQFILNDDYLSRLIEFSKDSIFQADNPIDQHFLEEKIFVDVILDAQSAWGWDLISHIFHVGTKDVPLAHSINDYSKFIDEYVSYCEKNSNNIVPIETEKSGELLVLPEPDLTCYDSKTLYEVLNERMTSRFFYSTPLALMDVSNLLYATFGQIHGPWEALEALKLQSLSVRKSSPSAGGLHASEAYVVANNVDGIPKGIYHYRSHQHLLSRVTSDWDASCLGRLLAGQKFAEDLPLGIFVTSRFDKLWDKYPHSRSYRVALLDIGHLSQTFQLCATALGLECWLTGVFLDTEVNELLHIENTSEQTMFFVGAGKGRHQCLDDETIKFLERS
jgi:SagB-type dehydrogenase family enzyme